MAATEVFSNQPSTTVVSGGTDAPASGTVETWTVASSSSFPSASTGVSQFHVVDAASASSSEIALVTNVSGVTWTVTRGAEGTTPVAHASGFTIFQVVTAGWLNGVPLIDSTATDIQAAPATRAAGSVGKAADAGHVHPQPPMLAPTGLTGATSVSRYVGGTDGSAPISGTFAVGDYVIDQTGTIRVCYVAGSPGSWTVPLARNTTVGNIQPSPGTAAAGSVGQAADAGHVHGQPSVFAPTGLTGATAASRYVGATTSGHPTAGTFVAGDLAADQTGNIWVCTVGGTPGTWQSASGISLNSGVSQAGSLQVFGSMTIENYPIVMSGQKITGMANGSAATDAAAFGQLPGTWTAVDAGFAAWAYDSAGVGAGVSTRLITAGALNLIGLQVRAPVTVSTIVLILAGNGGTLTSGECFVGLYSSGGSLLGYSADQSTAWSSGAAKSINAALTAESAGTLTLAAGMYYVAILGNGTTMPSFESGANLVNQWANGALTTATARYGTNGSGLTALPTSFTPSGTTLTGITWWTAIF